MISIMNIPPVFARLPASAISRRTAAPGEVIFRKGDPAGGMIFVISGELALLRHGEAGEPVPLAHAGPGETLAESALFADAYHCDCVALTRATAMTIRKHAVIDQIARDADFALAMVARLSDQLRQCRRRLEILSIRPAEARVLAAMAEFGQPGSARAFAQGIGLTPEATYRALAALVRQGRLERVGRGRFRLAT